MSGRRNDLTDIVFIGTAIMDSMIRGFDPEPVSAAGYRAESGYLSIGGEAVNGSIASVKLGSKAAILCTLGNDMAGDMIASRLADSGVDTDRIVRSDEHPTPVTTIFMSPDGNRRSITNGSHRYNFHPERYPSVSPGPGPWCSDRCSGRLSTIRMWSGKS
jgi:sugar/nucleoside kinase (ribokinase family)